MGKVNMKKIFVLCMTFLVMGCTFQTKHRGYVFPSDVDAKLKKITNVSDLVSEIGMPQTKTIHGEEVWIYYGSDENYRGPLAPTFDNKTVLLVWVNGNHVKKMQLLHNDDLPDVEIDENETQIPAAIELNAIEELFNNIGRFTPAGLGQ